MSKGIVILARNNEHYDYAKIAVLCAKMAKEHLCLYDELCLITDTPTYNASKESIDKTFDKVIEVNDNTRPSYRRYHDTPERDIDAHFMNLDRSEVYDLSPYDETLLIDSDYLIMSDVLDQVWGSVNDFMIHYDYCDLGHTHNTRRAYLDGNTIPMAWATVVYFRKSVYAQSVFTMIKHIRKNYKYYCTLFKAKDHLYRNDYVFAMALHIINGGLTDKVPTLPNKYLVNSFDIDEIYKFKSTEEVIILCAKRRTSERKKRRIKEQPQYDTYMTRLLGADIHIMNKKSLLRHADALLELLENRNV